MHVSLSENSPEITNPAPAVQPAINAAQQCVVVKAPVDRVYGQWSRIEDLPRFITSLRDVRRIDDMHFSYVWHPNGQDKQGIFQIVLQIPGRRIAWRTTSNGFMSGVVSFEPRSEQETEIILKIRSIFDSPNLARRAEEYLHNFKRLVENEKNSATS
jgi:uncharacterized membrane protein